MGNLAINIFMPVLPEKSAEINFKCSAHIVAAILITVL